MRLARINIDKHKILLENNLLITSDYIYINLIFDMIYSSDNTKINPLFLSEISNSQIFKNALEFYAVDSYNEHR